MRGYAERLARMRMGRVEQAAHDLGLGTTEACAGTLIVRHASVAGGLGACYAPMGSARGKRPLEKHESTLQRGARGVPSGCCARSHVPRRTSRVEVRSARGE